MTSEKTESLIKGIKNKDIGSLSRAITLVESTLPTHQLMASEIINACHGTANESIRIGITGVPGVGKSSFIEQFGLLLAEMGKKVAVLAVDPSSTISQGSILGDKTRMPLLSIHPNAYVRPSPAGKSLGGVGQKSQECIVLCEAAGFDVVLVETVGVGQSETLVHQMVDFFLLLKLAGAGDDLQGIKRGIMEMADAVVINKADGTNIDAAQLAKNEFERALHLYPPKPSGWQTKVLTCSAIENKGIKDIWNLISTFIQNQKENGFFQRRRSQQRELWFIDGIHSRIGQWVNDHKELKKRKDAMLTAVQQGEYSPFWAADEFMKKFTEIFSDPPK